ncbi:hypothetical protein HC891_25355 [Candidatus Gracilibacteria bacterium]|nr:hypothetical protein [Candidatus Gracilibacteria bacterium]
MHVIIQHPDGSYEICPLTPALANWLNTQLQRARTFVSSSQAYGVLNMPCQAEETAATCNYDDNQMCR